MANRDTQTWNSWDQEDALPREWNSQMRIKKGTKTQHEPPDVPPQKYAEAPQKRMAETNNEPNLNIPYNKEKKQNDGNGTVRYGTVRYGTVRYVRT